MATESVPNVFNFGDWEKYALNGIVQKPVLHVEVLQNRKSKLQSQNILFLVHKYLKSVTVVSEDCILDEFEEQELQQHIDSISLCDMNSYAQGDGKGISLHQAKVLYHVYQLNDDGPNAEDFDSEELSTATHWILPSSDFHGLWESLVYDSDIKSQLLNFVSTTLLFSEKKVDHNIISWNRIVLLHGPPGTGKTSLCKALAQKLCIRLNSCFRYGQLIEINSHSLFSKWFSESGKLVMKMFQKIQELIDEQDSLVFILIDEVESLAHARKMSMNGTEPSDSIRVVNALLTQIDHLKRYSNVIILTTSNITGAIDLAFVDRADIKQYIGLPSLGAIYQIYYSCIKELQKVNIIYTKETIFPLRQLNVAEVAEADFASYSLRLKDIARKSEGLSGRTLRKLPFLAHALHLQSSVVTLDNFLEALSKTVDKQFQDRKQFTNINEN